MLHAFSFVDDVMFARNGQEQAIQKMCMLKVTCWQHGFDTVVYTQTDSPGGSN